MVWFLDECLLESYATCWWVLAVCSCREDEVEGDEIDGRGEEEEQTLSAHASNNAANTHGALNPSIKVRRRG